MDPTSATIEIHVYVYTYTYIVWICMIYWYIVSTFMKIRVPTNHSWDPRLPSPRSRPNPGISRKSKRCSTTAACALLKKKTWITSNDNFFPIFRLVRIPFEAINHHEPKNFIKHVALNIGYLQNSSTPHHDFASPKRRHKLGECFLHGSGPQPSDLPNGKEKQMSQGYGLARNCSPVCGNPNKKPWFLGDVQY